jgi:regulator of ribosome biosynthesis
MFRHGYQKANDDVNKQWPIMEVKGNQDPFEDPWERQREAKKARVDKNTEQHMRNQERAGLLPKGTTNRTTKSRDITRKAGKQGGNLDRDKVTTLTTSLPVGVPVDLRGGRKDVAASSALGVERNPLKRGKESTMAALRATQRSTASLGKFDQMREGEPERKKTLASMKRRKYESATDKKVMATEHERSLKLLKTVVERGGVAKEKAIRKGHLAKGETPYDYDYNDGLGPSTFKKRKGRAGAGKARKMTKKRIK